MPNQAIPDLMATRAAILGAVGKNANMLIALGALLLVLGVIGTLGQVVYSFISIGIIGAFAIFAGVLQAIHAMQSTGWKSVSIQWVFALFYLIAGLMAWFFPIPALEGLTIWLAVTFFATGALRLIQAFQHQPFSQWFWLLLSSVMSIVLGFLIMKGWPSSSLWVPGLLMAIEFMLQGWALIFIGIAAKSTQS